MSFVPAHTSTLFTDLEDAVAPPEAGCVVESLKPTARNPERVMIRISGRKKVVATLAWSMVADLGIERGTSWTDELATKVHQAIVLDKATRSAMGTLERRALSKGELVSRLKRKKCPSSVAVQVADQLESDGYLDDTEYARAVLRSLVAGKPAGPRLMRQKLMQKMVDRTIADQVIGEFVDQQHAENEERDPFQDDDPIAQLVIRRLRSMSTLDYQTKTRRVYGLLARRGFDPGVCRTYVEHFVRRDNADEIA